MFSLKNNPVLTNYQIKVLKIFFASELGKQFFLTGGTALAAFYLGHRQSNDLDLFALEQFDSLQLEKVIGQIAEQTSSKVRTRVKTSDYCEIYLENEKEGWVQRLDFVQEPKVFFGKKQVVDGICIDSLENIASNKILTIYGRLEPKDYLDLYFILKETKLSFDRLFQKTKQKDPGLHEFYFANLIAEVDRLQHFPKTLKPFSREKLVDFYLKLSEEMFKKIKPTGLRTSCVKTIR
jgi:predicted nucleotidyltransferase component of viral defense system